MECNKINFKRNPWSGIFSEIAAEQGKTPQAVRQSWHRRNVKTIELVKRKIEEREKLSSYKDLVTG